MPRVIMLRGVSGSGKSTVAGTLAQLGYVVVSADKYFLTIDRGYVFDATKLNLAHDYCFDMFRMELLAGNNVVVDNTNTTEKEMSRYIDFANERGYHITSLVVENRHGNKSVHNVPETKLQQQAQRLQQSIKLI